MTPALFIDRDECINKCPAGIPGDPAGYITRYDQFEFYEDVMDAFKLMNTMNYEVFIVSNQSGIARPNIKCDYGDIKKIFDKMELEIHTQSGIPITESYFCPHIGEHNCACRKPKPGMIWHLAVKYEIDLGKSVMIGDSRTDILAGWNAGIRRLIKIDREAAPVIWDDKTTPKFPKNTTSPLRVPGLLNAFQCVKVYDEYIKRVWGPLRNKWCIY
ncbi:MAG: D-glycero-alpha-D-manno-heptose-1,7-bisphosphate 7-phosphatase [Candidatus Thorarchaeota archaeon]|jgi:D-glycero-D-manno-heptose 1,7-bisphosphate phosphatase